MNSTTAIDFRTLPQNIPSLCIPRVFSNIDESRIRRIFNELDMGEIERIDIVGKTTEKGEKFNRVFVHFKKWFVNKNADIARERLINGKEIKIIYDDPWFWKVSAYRERDVVTTTISKEKPIKKKATFQFDDEDEKESKPRDQRDLRDQRSQRDQRDQRSHYEPPRDQPRDLRDQPRDLRDQPRDLRDQPRDQPRDLRPRDLKDPRQRDQRDQRDPRQRETKMVPRQVQERRESERREPKRSLEKPKPKEEIIEIKEEAIPKKQRNTNTKKKVIKLEAEEETSISLEETIKNLNNFTLKDEEEGEIKA
jgi:hypothetical protein